jgi:hypothetical protein
MSLSQQLIVQPKNNNFLISPTSLAEAMEYSKMIANSSFCPSAMKGKPGDVIIAMQLGAEVGLSPMQALQNIAVINGRPSLWGDAALALVLSSPHYISHREWTEGSIKEGNLTAYCGITRKYSEEYIKSFSQADAERAGLWKKAGPWTQYPERMLQMRARAFAIRDKFADALRGINVAEEVQDYEIIEARKNSIVPIKPKQEVKQIIEAVEIPEAAIELNIDEMVLDITQTTTVDELEKVFKLHYKACVKERNKEALDKIIDAKNNQKNKFTTEQFIEELDAVDPEKKQ